MGDAASVILLVKICGLVTTDGAVARNEGELSAQVAGHMASVLPGEPLYRYINLPLSFRIRGSY
jgi:hypothetical protein